MLKLRSGILFDYLCSVELHELHRGILLDSHWCDGNMFFKLLSWCLLRSWSFVLHKLRSRILFEYLGAICLHELRWGILLSHRSIHLLKLQCWFLCEYRCSIKLLKLLNRFLFISRSIILHKLWSRILFLYLRQVRLH